MNLDFKKINKDNYDEVLKLHVSKDQIGYIESIEDCLEEAKEYSLWRPIAIYDGEIPVGFAMYGLFLNEGEFGRVWLDRIMIGDKYQGKGYGKASVKLLIKRLYKEYGHRKIYLSVYDDNINAIQLYERIGFKFNGEEDTNGEKIMEINLNDMEDLYV
ncbi:MAG: GNAT family N-acetyltransferase [Peptostreptococcaceae bacterium]|nr:GNAT family N-acetyltransferase [Peptostreptococcaceae bacterium]